MMAAAVLLVFFNFYFTKGMIGSLIMGTVKRPANFAVAELSDVRLFFSELVYFKNLISNNIELKNQNTELTYQLARHEDFREENEFLKKALGLGLTSEFIVIEGGVFGSNFSQQGYRMLLNRGSAENVSTGDIVISETGVFIGQIGKIFKTYSEVGLVTNPDFKVTVKVLGSDISAMARGGLSEGIYLDFVNHDDDIKEGDVIVTNGSDLVPPALILGTVNYVEADPVSLFKKVKLKPAIDGINLGRVLVIKSSR